MELSARKKQILKRVIEDYIASAEPVGSKAIAQEMGGSVSSATVRNELAELSDLGYLEQPHTSAGRVPSPKGYRLYVNELMERREVSETEAEEINETLQDKMSAAGSMISQAGQMASSIVDYPAYAVAEGKSGVTVKRFELLGVDDTSFITVVMTDDSRVKSQLQRSPLAFDRARLTDLSALPQHALHQAVPRGDERKAHGAFRSDRAGAVSGALRDGRLCRRNSGGGRQKGRVHHRREPDSEDARVPRPR